MLSVIRSSSVSQDFNRLSLALSSCSHASNSRSDLTVGISDDEVTRRDAWPRQVDSNELLESEGSRERERLTRGIAFAAGRAYGAAILLRQP